MGAHILVVDDERDLLEKLQPVLAAHGYRVSTAPDGKSALSLVAAHPPDLILLDLIMPELDGFEVCQQLRADPQLRHIPVVMLTALHEISAVVRSLDIGADDYITKPFNLPELLLRIRTRLDAAHAGPLRIGDLVISRARHELRCDGRTEPLTPRELDLVELFARQPNQVLSRQTVLAAVWGGDDGAASTVDVYIGRLRRKLAALHSAVRLRTVRGDGFVLDTPQE